MTPGQRYYFDLTGYLHGGQYVDYHQQYRSALRPRGLRLAEHAPRLSPETRELLEFAPFIHVKNIVKEDVITQS